MKFVATTQAGLALGEYDEHSPLIWLSQGRPQPRMKRPLDLAPGGETAVDYPLEGPRVLTVIVRRVDENEAARPSPIPNRPRVLEIEQPARNVKSAEARDPKPPVKVEAPPASTTRRRVVRKTP